MKMRPKYMIQITYSMILKVLFRKNMLICTILVHFSFILCTTIVHFYYICSKIYKDYGYFAY